MADSMNKEIDDGGSAFPAISNGSLGMTLRDYFAAKAMQQLLAAALDPSVEGDAETAIAQVPAAAYEMADLMLKASAAHG